MSADRRFTGTTGDGRRVLVMVWDDATVAEVWWREEEELVVVAFLEQS